MWVFNAIFFHNPDNLGNGSYHRGLQMRKLRAIAGRERVSGVSLTRLNPALT